MCIYSCLSNNKIQGAGLYNSIHNVDHRKYFSGPSNLKSKGSALVSLGEVSGENLEMFLLRKR